MKERTAAEAVDDLRDALCRQLESAETSRRRDARIAETARAVLIFVLAVAAMFMFSVLAG